MKNIHNFLKYTFISFCLSIVLVFGITNCKSKPDKAQQIINESIKAHGGEHYDQLKVSFDFRDKHYKIDKDGDQFTYIRIGKDTSGNEIKDVFSNEGLIRFVANKQIELADSMAKKYKNSINSVVYFALLPKPLNDEAAIKTYLGEGQIGADHYHKIKVTFQQENGGKDHEDEFVYWINKATNLMDYFVYSYKTDGGGIRFRERIKSQSVAGVRFQDYINYAPIDSTYSLQDFDIAFSEGKLREFSRIENLNLKVDF
ncbi:MAG: DUF6503 family protein [Bacteroidota bacterium]